MTSYTLELVDFNPFEKTPIQESRKPMGVGESFAVGAGQGASAGFGDEMIAGLGAGFAGTGLNITNALGITDVERPYGQSYENILNRQRTGIEQAATDNPLFYLGGNVVGAIGGAGKLAAPLATTKIGGKIAAATLPTAAGRAVAGTAKAAAPAAASGAVYGFGGSEGGFDNRIEQAGEDAVLSAALGVAAKPVIGAIKGIGEVGKGAFARGNKQLASASNAMKNATNQSYAEMRKYNVALNQNGIRKVADNVVTGLQDELIDGELNKNFSTLMKGFGKQISKGTDIEHLDKWRRKFYSMADGIKSTDPIVKDNARLAGIVARKLDNALYNQLDDNADFIANSTNALEALKRGRSNSMQQRKFEIVSDIVKKSKGDVNYVKRELAKISDASTKKGEGQLRFFTPDEAAELAKVADLGTGEAVLKIAGKFGFDSARLGRGVGAAVGAGAGGAAAGLGGAIAVPAIGTAASMAQKGLVQGRADTLLKTIERGGQSSPQANIRIPATARGSVVASQPEQAQPAPQFNLEPVDFNPFEQQGTDEAYSPPRQPLEMTITPQSNTFTDDIPQVQGGMDAPLGIRNNNPGNLRGNDLWLGRSGVDEQGFVQFKTPQAGIRALAINLKNQQKKYGINTIEVLVSKYAPSNENDTQGYIRFVSQQTGIQPNQKINLSKPDVLYKLSKAIMAMENGEVHYDDKTIRSAITSAVKGSR